MNAKPFFASSLFFLSACLKTEPPAPAKIVEIPDTKLDHIKLPTPFFDPGLEALWIEKIREDDWLKLPIQMENFGHTYSPREWLKHKGEFYFLEIRPPAIENYSALLTWRQQLKSLSELINELGHKPQLDAKFIDIRDRDNLPMEDIQTARMFFRIQASKTSSAFTQSTCNYVSEFVHASQLIAKHETVAQSRNKKDIVLSCTIRRFDETPSNAPLIQLKALPMPWALKKGQKPFFQSPSELSEESKARKISPKSF